MALRLGCCAINSQLHISSNEGVMPARFTHAFFVLLSPRSVDSVRRVGLAKVELPAGARKAERPSLLFESMPADGAALGAAG